MYYIISKHNMAIHREPTRASWESKSYASAAAAKAGITRTMKYYNKAKAEVAEVVAQGKPEYHARMYNAFRDATERHPHCADIENYVVMSAEEYEFVEPMITHRGIAPGTGEEITYTCSINEPRYLNPLSESYWSA